MGGITPGGIAAKALSALWCSPPAGFGQNAFGKSGLGRPPRPGLGRFAFGESGFGRSPLSDFGQPGFGRLSSGLGRCAFGESGFGRFPLSDFGQPGFGRLSSVDSASVPGSQWLQAIRLLSVRFRSSLPQSRCLDVGRLRRLREVSSVSE